MNAGQQPTSNPTVLIVDDDPESLLLVSTMVEYIGYHPVTAISFDAALTLLQGQPAAVVLDLVMPEDASVRLLAEMCRTDNATPVVLMSAARKDELGAIAVEHVRLGINVVSTLAKPFWVDVLVTALEKAIPSLPDAVVGAQ